MRQFKAVALWTLNLAPHPSSSTTFQPADPCQVGGLTYGVAKNVTLWAVRAMDCQGNAKVSAILEVRVGWAEGGCGRLSAGRPRPFGLVLVRPSDV